MHKKTISQSQFQQTCMPPHPAANKIYKPASYATSIPCMHAYHTNLFISCSNKNAYYKYLPLILTIHSITLRIMAMFKVDSLCESAMNTYVC